MIPFLRLPLRLLPALACWGALLLAGTAAAAPTVSYPQSAPSNQEQYLLELINAARANPPAEGRMLAGITDPAITRYYSFYKVSTGQLASDFSGYAARPPLAFNPQLMAVARAQSLYQAASGVQTHSGPDGSTFDRRIAATGYQWSGLGENVYAYAQNVFFGHAGLTADWGVPSLDHRQNLLNYDGTYGVYREVGLACVPSSVTNFGPLVITQDFGTPADAGAAYLTGVVYQDTNGNGAYDEGEGLGGVTVTPDGGTYYAVTTASGGFTIPLPATGSGTLTVTASGGGLGAPRVHTVAYTAGTNVKLDFTAADPVGAPLPTVTLQATSKDAAPGGLTGKIVLSRGGDAAAPLTVALGFGGTAVNGVDCAALPGSVVFPTGAATVTLPVEATAARRGALVKLKVFLQPGSGYLLESDPALLKARVRVWPAQ